MRCFQATYKVKQLHWPNQGHGFRMRLIWDHNRLWGTFELGCFTGVLLIDPGPGQDHFRDEDEYQHEWQQKQARSRWGVGRGASLVEDQREQNRTSEHVSQNDDDESQSQDQFEVEDEDQDEENPSPSEEREYPFTWRGTSTETPDTLFHSPLTVGKIRFGSNEIWGHFDAMLGVGLPNGRCDFHGKRPLGPAIVALSIPGVVDTWNEHGIFCDDEVPRQSSAKSDGENEDGNGEDALKSEEADSSEETSDDEIEDHEEITRILTGIFPITSREVSSQWPFYARNLKIRFHSDPEQQRMWGRFDVGIYEGYLLLSLKPEELAWDTPMEFCWRARENETGCHRRGKGEVSLSSGCEVKGVFEGMCGDIDFEGRRQLMPGGISGLDVDSYRRGWKEFATHADSDFYGTNG